jgi:hypothetical protein
MKDNGLYPVFISHLDSQLFEQKISKGKYSLLKISNSYFESFKKKFEDDELFRKKVLESHKSEVREKKINDLFDDFDL